MRSGMSNQCSSCIGALNLSSIIAINLCSALVLKVGALKLQDWTLRDWAMKDEMAGMDVAGLDSVTQLFALKSHRLHASCDYYMSLLRVCAPTPAYNMKLAWKLSVKFKKSRIVASSTRD